MLLLFLNLVAFTFQMFQNDFPRRLVTPISEYYRGRSGCDPSRSHARYRSNFLLQSVRIIFIQKGNFHPAVVFEKSKLLLRNSLVFRFERFEVTNEQTSHDDNQTEVHDDTLGLIVKRFPAHVIFCQNSKQIHQQQKLHDHKEGLVTGEYVEVWQSTGRGGEQRQYAASNM